MPAAAQGKGTISNEIQMLLDQINENAANKAGHLNPPLGNRIDELNAMKAAGLPLKSESALLEALPVTNQAAIPDFPNALLDALPGASQGLTADAKELAALIYQEKLAAKAGQEVPTANIQRMRELNNRLMEQGSGVQGRGDQMVRDELNKWLGIDQHGSGNLGPLESGGLPGTSQSQIPWDIPQAQTPAGPLSDLVGGSGLGPLSDALSGTPQSFMPPQSWRPGTPRSWRPGRTT